MVSHPLLAPWPSEVHLLLFYNSDHRECRSGSAKREKGDKVTVGKINEKINHNNNNEDLNERIIHPREFLPAQSKL